MKKSTAAAGAGAVVLTVAGAVSGLFLTLGAAGPADATPAQPVVLTEYVDEAGNPVAPPVARTGPSLPRFVVVEVEPVATAEEISEVAAQISEPPASSDTAYGSDDRDGRYDEDWEDEDREEDEDRDEGDDDD